METQQQKLPDLAALNLRRLMSKTYPGRVIVTGIDETNQFVVHIAAIMGRSDDSRNRKYVESDGIVSTAWADEAKAGSADPTNVIYTTMNSGRGVHAVSNGHHTAEPIESSYETLAEAMKKWSHERDGNNRTARIIAITTIHGDSRTTHELTILRKSQFGGEGCDRAHFQPTTPDPGYGLMVHTYLDDGKPLPAFTGEPMVVPIIGNIVHVRDTFWGHLDGVNRVAIAVKFVPIKGGPATFSIYNRFPEVDYPCS